MTIWYIVYPFCTFFPVLVSCTKKNLATLCLSAKIQTSVPKYETSYLCTYIGANFVVRNRLQCLYVCTVLSRFFRRKRACRRSNGGQRQIFFRLATSVTRLSEISPTYLLGECLLWAVLGAIFPL
jgi:hypothetical protein